jgi:hypothetical protein
LVACVQLPAPQIGKPPGVVPGQILCEYHAVRHFLAAVALLKIESTIQLVNNKYDDLDFQFTFKKATQTIIIISKSSILHGKAQV